MTRARERAWLALGCVVMLGCAVAVGCAAQGGLGGAAVSAVPAFLEGARNANAAADRAVSRGDWDAAREALEGAIAAEPPAGMAEDDVRVVRQDLLFRLSQVELSAGNAARAADRADEGLNIGMVDDVFTANLLVARGRAREAQDREREAAGDYYDALEINEKLLHAALGDEEEGP